MKFLTATCLLFAASLAQADVGYLKCEFDGGELVIEGPFDGKNWNVEQIDQDGGEYGDVEVTKQNGEINFYINTADLTGGDPDYTEIYDITIHGELNLGQAVPADVEGNYFSRDDGTPFSMKGQCQLN